MLRTGPIEYRREAGVPGTIAIFHGGHMRAALPLGERVFRERGFSVLVPSRPGYGLTPLTTVRTPNDFADAVAVLCESLNIDELTAVVGVSAGGRSAIAMAARQATHPAVLGLILALAGPADSKCRVHGVQPEGGGGDLVRGPHAHAHRAREGALSTAREPVDASGGSGPC